MQGKIQLVAPRGLRWNIEGKQVNAKHKYDEQQLQDELLYTWWVNLAAFQHQDTLCHRSHPRENLCKTSSAQAQLFWGWWLQKEITCHSFQAMRLFYSMCDVHPILPSMEWTQRNFSSSILFLVLVIFFVLCSSQDLHVSPPNVTKLAKLTTPPLLAPPARAPLYPPPQAAPEWKED